MPKRQQYLLRREHVEQMEAEGKSVGFIRHPRQWREGTAFSDYIKEELGVAGKPLPAEGMPARMIDGIEVRVLPLPPKVTRARRFSLRVQGRCPYCQCWFAVSRLQQHAPSCKQKDSHT